MTRQAYPTADQGVLNTLAIERFIDALPDPYICLRLRYARPKDINEAEIIAIRLETHQMTEAQRTSTLSLNPMHSNEFESLREELFDIKRLVMSNRNPKPAYSPFISKPESNPRF